MTAASLAVPFTEALASLGDPVRPLLAVSGGGDSLALLLLAQEARRGRFEVATFDHGLRPASAAEAAFVGEICAERQVPHAVLSPEHPIDGEWPEDAAAKAALTALMRESFVVGSDQPSGLILPKLPRDDRGSLQARARTARYDALAAHALARGCDAILTAHHRDDQAETLLMRASRGSGVGGLAGIRTIMHWRGVAVLRPLLDWPRARLTGLLPPTGLTPVEDPSNTDPAYDRTRFRQLLSDAPLLDPAGLARSAAALAEASDALQWSVTQLAETRITTDGAVVLVDATGLPTEYRRRLLTSAFERLDGHVSRGSSLDSVVAGMRGGRQVSLGNRLIRERPDGVWEIAPAPPRRTR